MGEIDPFDREGAVAGGEIGWKDTGYNETPSKWDELYNNLVPCHVNDVLLCHVTEQPELCVNCDKYNSSTSTNIGDE